ncbi:MAG: hypothetical protein ACE5IW_11275 [bacterium]
MNYEELCEEITIEFEALDIIVAELIQVHDEYQEGKPSIREITAAGAFLAQFYNGIENILKRFYKFSGQSLPQGFDWHIALFKAFCDPPTENLPLIFTNELETKFVPFRRFRHVVHHGYGFQLDWDRIKPGIEEIQSIYSQFKKVVKLRLTELEP